MIYKILIINKLDFILGGGQNAHSTQDEVSLAELENDEEESAWRSVVGRPQLLSRPLPSRDPVRTGSASNPVCRTGKAPEHCSCAHLRIHPRVAAPGSAEMWR